MHGTDTFLTPLMTPQGSLRRGPKKYLFDTPSDTWAEKAARDSVANPPDRNLSPNDLNFGLRVYLQMGSLRLRAQ